MLLGKYRVRKGRILKFSFMIIDVGLKYHASVEHKPNNLKKKDCKVN